MKEQASQKHSILPIVMITLLLICLSASRLQGQLKFQGRVFWVSQQSDVGNWNKATAISGVTVTLYGSNDPGDPGQKITSQKSNSSGYYELYFQTGYEIYTIIETQPSNYTSLDATSPDGTKINSNKIQFTTEKKAIGDQDLTGNIFWEKPEGSSNNPPNAVNDNVTTAKNTTVKIKVLGNDSDPDGDAISLKSVASPGHGTAVKSGNQVKYTPASGYTGTDNFNYTISDGKGGTDQAKVTVTVQGGTSDDCEIRGMKFNDSNQNGQKDTWESGLSGWTIFLDANTNGTLDTGEKNITTAADGSYGFTELSAGTYRVVEVQQTDWIQTVPDNPNDYYEFSLSTGQIAWDNDFGNYYSGVQEYDYGDAPSPYPDAWHTPGDVWFGYIHDRPDTEFGTQPHPQALGDDHDGNDDENSLIKYSLIKSNLSLTKSVCFEIEMLSNEKVNMKIASWIDFNQDGDWDDVDEYGGNYFISYTGAPKFIIVLRHEMPADALPGVTIARLRVYQTPATPVSHSGYGGPGEVEDYEIEITPLDEPIPEGNYVFGYKWNDMDGNGLWDSDESGLPNWTIWLDANQNGVEDTGDQYTQTDYNGYFIFTGLRDGTYKVREELQPGWTQTYSTDSVKVEEGKINLAIYFGNKQEDAPIFDFGDAPAPYPTLLADNGARHIMGRPFLGTSVDVEMDGQPVSLGQTLAQGDDQNGIDDEDCYSSWEIIPGENCLLYCKADTTGYLNVWLDLNIDGDWADADEHIIVDQQMSPSLVSPPYYVYKKKVFIPLTADTGNTFFRFRISSVSGLSYDGEAPDGEVEDLEDQIYLRDFGDAPSPYPVTRSDNGLSFYSSKNTHWLLICLGNTVDGEYDGMQSPQAKGDDVGGSDDEDGIRFLTSFIPGQTAEIEYTVTSLEDMVNISLGGWIDYNQDGDWSDTGEKVIDKDLGRITSTTDTIVITVPSSAVTGTTYGRFTLSYKNTPAPQGAVNEAGEVEDYEIYIEDTTSSSGIDYGDAPSSYPQASHTIAGGTWFGGLNDAPDAESAYISHPHALEDDVSGDRDDEDGLISSNFIAGQKSGFRFSYVFGDTCDHFMTFCIDLDRDGKWTGWWTKEKFHLLHLALSPYPPVNTPLPVQVVWNKPPASTPPGPTFLRMRIVKGWPSDGLQEYGHQETGEVEDHEVMIKSSGNPEPPGGLIWGYKYEDLNGNGAWDTTKEPALPSWTVWLDEDNDGIPDHFTTTDASGEFRFTGLADGTYTVGEVQQPGWVRTWPPDPGTHSITVNTSQDFRLIPALFFGNQHTGEEGEGAMKWWQQPLLYPGENDTIFYRGWRETSLYGDTSIADDWFCYDPRPVTRIQWWGAYADWDSLYPPTVRPHQFHISIWTDVPREDAEGWSHPGILLREYWVDRTEVYESWDEFYYSPDSTKTPASCFKYTYNIPSGDWFYQDGDSTVYWLSIAAVYEERPDSLVWGWLTREHYFHDDAVRIYDPVEPNPGDEFQEGKPLTDFWDMSFILGTDEIDDKFDFGDAPDDRYGTTVLWNGAQHLMDSSLYLGQALDDDYDGQPNLGSQGDDDDGLDDENGVFFSGDLVPGENSQISVQTSGPGFLNAWIDYNGDGDWRDEDEQVFTLRELTGGMQMLEFTVPDQAVEGLTYARFRFSTEPASAFCGFMMDGEVEDYQVYIGYGTKVLDQPHNHIPDQFYLHPNYPNPFNPSTTITFEIPAAVQVRMVVYNLRGQEISQLIDRRMEAGRYSVHWDGRDKYGQSVSTGVYLCRLITDQFSDTVKLLLMK